MQPVCRLHTDTNLLFFGTAIRATNSSLKAKCGRSRKGAQDPTVLPSCPRPPKRQRGASRLAVTKANSWPTRRRWGQLTPGLATAPPAAAAAPVRTSPSRDSPASVFELHHGTPRTFVRLCWARAYTHRTPLYV